jgi:hypothetical protein
MQGGGQLRVGAVSPANRTIKFDTIPGGRSNRRSFVAPLLRMTAEWGDDGCRRKTGNPEHSMFTVLRG